MTDFVDAVNVGHVVVFVAPGFLARLAYRTVLPDKEPQQWTLLITSVVASLPLLAVTNAVAAALGIDQSVVTAIPYVLVLVVVSMLIGYLLGLVRSSRIVGRLADRLALRYAPEPSIWSLLLRLPPDASITVEFLDGRRLSGCPAAGPGRIGDDVQELLLTFPAWWQPATGEWTSTVEGAVIVPLRAIHSVTLDRKPE